SERGLPGVAPVAGSVTTARRRGCDRSAPLRGRSCPGADRRAGRRRADPGRGAREPEAPQLPVSGLPGVLPPGRSPAPVLLPDLQHAVAGLTALFAAPDRATPGREAPDQTGSRTRIPTGRRSEGVPHSREPPLICASGLDVVVEVELPGVRAEADGVDLPGALVLDPGIDDVLGEDVAGQHELVVGFQGREGGLE